MRFGWARFYADEDIEDHLIVHLRDKGYHVDSARELGFAKKDDRFQLHEARRRKAVLLTRDLDFLNHRVHRFDELGDTGIVILRTEDKPETRVEFGYMLLALQKELGPSGSKGLHGLKIELRGPRMVLYARVNGRIRKDEVDISKPYGSRELFLD